MSSLSRSRDSSVLGEVTTATAALTERLAPALRDLLERGETSGLNEASRAAAALRRQMKLARKAADEAPGKAEDRRIRRTLASWDKLERALDLARAGASHPLRPLPDDPGPTTSALIEGLIALDRATGQTEAAKAHGCYPFVALHPVHFSNLCHAGRRVLAASGAPEKAAFLDVGAGAGSKLPIAAHYFHRLDGIEFDAGYVAEAARVLSTGASPRCRVFAGDALTFDHYADYDVIYLFRPMSDEPKLRQLESRVAAKARRNAIILAPYSSFGERAAANGLHAVTREVYLKCADAAEAEALAERAARTGPEVARPEVIERLDGDPLNMGAPAAAMLARLGFYR